MGNRANLRVGDEFEHNQSTRARSLFLKADELVEEGAEKSRPNGCGVGGAFDAFPTAVTRGGVDDGIQQRVGHGAGGVHDGAETEERSEQFFSFRRRAVVIDDYEDHLLECGRGVGDAEEEAAVLIRRRRDLVRRFGQGFDVVRDEHQCTRPHGGLLLMSSVGELDDDAKGLAGTADGPEKITVFRVGSGHDGAVREHNLYGQQVVDGEPILSG